VWVVSRVKNVLCWSAGDQVTILCNKVVFCHVQTCDETKVNGESRDFQETVISSFSALFIGLRDSCSWRLHKGRNLRKRGMSKAFFVI